MKAETTWVLIADGARARIVRDLGASRESGERPGDLVFEIDHKKLREIMSDKPGRSFSSHGPQRSAMEYSSDPVQAQEEKFAGTLLKELERRHASGEFDRLAIIAEPRLLGVIRRILPSTLRGTIVKEVAKDLTKLPEQELREAIAELGIGRHRLA
ncbi:host attachment protein [Pseudochelatococcus sp. B33]